MNHTPPPRVKFLLVDDRPENLLALTALLRDDDVELLQARSGREALELLLRHEVALALVDVQMPEMDGFELAELMRGSQSSRDVPIIFVTAGAREQHRIFKGYESGAVDFLYKPIDASVLKSKAGVFAQLQRQKLQLAQELHERTETLRLNEMFTAVLGHDLRGPLGAILMAAQALARSPDAPARLAGERVLRNGRLMKRLIADMLDLARARLGDGFPVDPAPADLGVLTLQVVGEFRAALPQRAIDVAQHGDLAGQWDADRMTQVAYNLIGNALHHGSGDAPVQVLLDGRDREAVVLSVTNAGAIDPDVLPTLFDPFRGRREGSSSAGLGLGLYIVEQIVQAHRGRVEVESDAARGTRFSVTIPRAVYAVDTV